MTVENLHERMLLYPAGPDHQSDAHPSEPPRPALMSEDVNRKKEQCTRA